MSKIYRPSKPIRYASFNEDEGRRLVHALAADGSREKIDNLIQYLEDHEHPVLASVLRGHSDLEQENNRLRFEGYRTYPAIRGSSKTSKDKLNGWSFDWTNNGLRWIRVYHDTPEDETDRSIKEASQIEPERISRRMWAISFSPDQKEDFKKGVSNLREEGVPAHDYVYLPSRSDPLDERQERMKRRRYAAFNEDENKRFAVRLEKEGDKKQVLHEWANYLEEHEHPAVAEVIRSHLHLAPHAHVNAWDQESRHPEGWGFDYEKVYQPTDHRSNSVTVSFPHPTKSYRVFFTHSDSGSEARAASLAKQLHDEGIPEYDNGRGSWIPPKVRHWDTEEKVREQRRYASKAPTGGIIVREGYRSKDPSATYHGGIAYPGGKFVPNVNAPKKKKAGRPRSVRWNGNLFGGEGPEPKSQYAAKKVRRYGSDSTNSHDYVRAIMQTGSWSPYLALADHAAKSGQHTIAHLLRVYHAQSFGKRDPRGNVAFGPKGYVSHWNYHPPGWSFELNNAYEPFSHFDDVDSEHPQPWIGRDSHIRLRHTLPGSTETARSWVMHFPYPEMAEKMADRLRKEGKISEHVTHTKPDGSSFKLWHNHDTGVASGTPSEIYAPPTSGGAKAAESDKTMPLVRKGLLYRPGGSVIRLAARLVNSSAARTRR